MHFICGLFTLLSSLVVPARADLPPLIPRDALFPKPAAMQSIRLSPDGRLISYIAADPAGVPQLWVRDVDLGTGTLTLDTKNPGGVPGNWFSADSALEVRAAQRVTQDGGSYLLNPMRRSAASGR